MLKKYKKKYLGYLKSRDLKNLKNLRQKRSAIEAKKVRFDEIQVEEKAIRTARDSMKTNRFKSAKKYGGNFIEGIGKIADRVYAVQSGGKPKKNKIVKRRSVSKRKSTSKFVVIGNKVYERKN